MIEEENCMLGEQEPRPKTTGGDDKSQDKQQKPADDKQKQDQDQDQQ